MVSGPGFVGPLVMFCNSGSVLSSASGAGRGRGRPVRLGVVVVPRVVTIENTEGTEGIVCVLLDELGKK